jgi:ATP phosphoribosyltransferase
MGMYISQLWSAGNLLRLLLLFIFFTSFVACQQKQAEVSGLSEKITIAYPMSIYSVLFAVADSKGFFKAEGMEVVPQPHEFGKITVQSMLEGKAEMAISGDTVAMFAVIRGEKINIIAQSMTSKRNMAIVARKDRGIKTPHDLEGKHIGVALETTGHFFLDSFLSVNGIRKNKVKVHIEFSWGATEVKVNAGLVDAIVELTETGRSLRVNKLSEIATICESTTQFIANQAAYKEKWKREKMEQIALLLKGAISAEGMVGLKMNAKKGDLKKVISLLPALKNPTVSPLAQKDWFAVETIIDEKVVRILIPGLKQAGAEGIIEYPLNKLIY